MRNVQMHSMAQTKAKLYGQIIQRQLWRGILEKMASEYDAPISHSLNISAKNISREADFSRGRDRPHSIDLLREHIAHVKFCGDTNASVKGEPNVVPIRTQFELQCPISIAQVGFS